MNISDEPNPAEDRFIHEIARLFALWGMPASAGRVCVYLLLQPEPVGLDKIAADLKMSKAGAWGAARHLERADQIERFGQPGSKRVLFGPARNFAWSLVHLCTLLEKLSGLFDDGAFNIAKDHVSERLRRAIPFDVILH